jgi:hypothetical protein
MLKKLIQIRFVILSEIHDMLLQSVLTMSNRSIQLAGASQRNSAHEPLANAQQVTPGTDKTQIAFNI